jgi:hypothetical protein
MPRSTTRSNSKLSEPKQNIPPPAKSQPQVQTQVQSPSMLDTMKQGFSFGLGSALAHSLFKPKPNDEKVIPREIANEPKMTTDKMYELYNKCLEKNDNNIDCSIILNNNK